MVAEADDALFRQGSTARAALSGARRTPSGVPPASRVPRAAAAPTDVGRLGAPRASPDRPVVPTPRAPIHAQPEGHRTGRMRADALEVEPGRRAGPPPRPRIVDDPSILGLARWSRGRLGSRAFTVFFVGVYALILMNLIHSLTEP